MICHNFTSVSSLVSIVNPLLRSSRTSFCLSVHDNFFYWHLHLMVHTDISRLLTKKTLLGVHSSANCSQQTRLKVKVPKEQLHSAIFYNLQIFNVQKILLFFGKILFRLAEKRASSLAFKFWTKFSLIKSNAIELIGFEGMSMYV